MSAVGTAAFWHRRCSWVPLAAGEHSPPGYRVFLSGAFSAQSVKVGFYGVTVGPVLVRVAPAPLSCPLSEYLHFQAKDAGQRTTIYKRDPSKQYGLKMKTSRAFFSEVERRFDTMPFTLRYSLSFPAHDPMPKPARFAHPRGGGGGGFCHGFEFGGFEWAQEGCWGLGRNPAAGGEPGIALKMKPSGAGSGVRRSALKLRKRRSLFILKSPFPLSGGE